MALIGTPSCALAFSWMHGIAENIPSRKTWRSFGYSKSRIDQKTQMFPYFQVPLWDQRFRKKGSFIDVHPIFGSLERNAKQRVGELLKTSWSTSTAVQTDKGGLSLRPLEIGMIRMDSFSRNWVYSDEAMTEGNWEIEQKPREVIYLFVAKKNVILHPNIMLSDTWVIGWWFGEQQKVPKSGLFWESVSDICPPPYHQVCNVHSLQDMFSGWVQPLQSLCIYIYIYVYYVPQNLMSNIHDLMIKVCVYIVCLSLYNFNIPNPGHKA